MRRGILILVVVGILAGGGLAFAGGDLSEGVAAYWEADYDRAEQILRTIDIWDLSDPEKVLLFKMLGATKLAQGDRGAAKQAFVDLLEIDPTYELSSSDFSPTVISVFREAQGELANIFYENGMELYNDGKFRDAVGQFEKALDADRNHPMAKEFLVIARERAALTGAAPDDTGKAGADDSGSDPSQPPISQVTPGLCRLGTLELGAQPYVDRGYVFRMIPAEFQGAQLVMTPNEEKENRSFKLSLELDRPATLYVAYDQRVKKPADWLAGWVRTGRVVSIPVGSDTVTYSVYSKRAPKGRALIGPNLTKQMRGGIGMYFVFAIAE